MAPITWKNIGDPSFGDVVSQGNIGTGIVNRGIDYLSKFAEDQHEQAVKDWNHQAGITTEGAIQALINSNKNLSDFHTNNGQRSDVALREQYGDQFDFEKFRTAETAKLGELQGQAGIAAQQLAQEALNRGASMSKAIGIHRDALTKFGLKDQSKFNSFSEDYSNIGLLGEKQEQADEDHDLRNSITKENQAFNRENQAHLRKIRQEEERLKLAKSKAITETTRLASEQGITAAMNYIANNPDLSPEDRLRLPGEVNKYAESLVNTEEMKAATFEDETLLDQTEKEYNKYVEERNAAIENKRKNYYITDAHRAAVKDYEIKNKDSYLEFITQDSTGGFWSNRFTWGDKEGSELRQGILNQVAKLEEHFDENSIKVLMKKAKDDAGGMEDTQDPDDTGMDLEKFAKSLAKIASKADKQRLEKLKDNVELLNLSRKQNELNHTLTNARKRIKNKALKAGINGKLYQSMSKEERKVFEDFLGTSRKQIDLPDTEAPLTEKELYRIIMEESWEKEQQDGEDYWNSVN